MVEARLDGYIARLTLTDGVGQLTVHTVTGEARLYTTVVSYRELLSKWQRTFRHIGRDELLPFWQKAVKLAAA